MSYQIIRHFALFVNSTYNYVADPSFLCLFTFLPIFLIIAVLIKIDSPGPMIFRQKRCGKDGKEFKMYKFRTMVKDAEKLHDEVLGKNILDGPMFKMKRDPRITNVGRFLRKTSLDELPQLFNVLKGEMSLVGPRPLAMEEMKFSPSWRDLRLKVKPGITGQWQVSGRSGTLFDGWIRHDIDYVKNQSTWLDLKLLMKTIIMVFKREGAF
ncbi:MAG: multidrug MFS transporter [Nitrospirae bacterium CG17_big_fil_post_rev_8_21_14_2_50_50_9]|nr:MAG: multidrug MFS transporter [Nitrospirae bacterium CG17_big_fil_post_rev_8_21_14_2_50_50_9]